MAFDEYLRRGTRFSALLAIEYWSVLTSKERIEFLFTLRRSIPDDLLSIALSDESSVVRMVAAQFSQGSQNDARRKAKSDPSQLVRGAFEIRIYSATALAALSQTERTVAIALSERVSGTALAEFIRNGVKDGSLSVEDAADLLHEFCCNPDLLSGYTEWDRIILGERRDAEGSLVYGFGQEFRDLWLLTTDLPYSVTWPISEEFPTDSLHYSIPVEVLHKAPEGVLAGIAGRGYRPLLDLIDKEPDKYSERVLEAKKWAEDRLRKAASFPAHH